jgi:two-component system, LytTR family, sensor kinase
VQDPPVALAAPLVPTRVGRVGLLFFLWSLPGLVSASQATMLWNPPLDLEVALIWMLPPWWYWGLMAPLVMRLGRRFRLESGGWASSVPLHLMANTVIALGHVALQIVLARALDQPNYASAFLPTLFRIAWKTATLEVFLYWGVLAAGWALEYHARFRERALAATRLEGQLVQAQLDALKSQLHPHFLFNTLHAISVLVRKQDTQGSIKMISGLSELLRLALDNVGRQVVPLEQELAFVDRYLAIEAIRFQDRLRVERDIAPNLLDAEIPNLVLQPLVENAIRHGISARTGPGTITLAAAQRGDRLVVTVTDDGVGLVEPCRTGVGLGNVRARLQQLYGDAAKLTLTAAEPGTVATVEVPFRRG